VELSSVELGREVVKRIAVSCEWCGQAVPYGGRGRVPRYCCRAHRQRAYEVRTAEARLGRALRDGQLRAAPVERVVERETIVRREVRVAVPHHVEPTMLVEQDPTPTKRRGGREWLGELEQLTAALAGGELGSQHWYHARIYEALGDVLNALDGATPGGLDYLIRTRRRRR